MNQDKTLRLVGHYCQLMMVDLMHAMVATPFKKLEELNEVEIQLLLTGAKKGSTYSTILLPCISDFDRSSFGIAQFPCAERNRFRGALVGTVMEKLTMVKSSIPLSTATSNTTSGRRKGQRNNGFKEDCARFELFLLRLTAMFKMDGIVYFMFRDADESRGRLLHSFSCACGLLMWETI